jgi:hypothetical protein
MRSFAISFGIIGGDEMPRYVLRLPVAGMPNSSPSQTLGVGTKIADAASAQAGDVQWDQLALSPNPACAPLDQAALNLILAHVTADNFNHYVTTIVSG